MAQQFAPVSGKPNEYRLVGRIDGSLWLMPDGVYRIEGRMIPVGDNAAISNDDRQFVVPVESPGDVVIGLLGSELGMNVK